jgi:hypothetical protein
MVDYGFPGAGCSCRRRRGRRDGSDNVVYLTMTNKGFAAATNQPSRIGGDQRLRLAASRAVRCVVQ